MKQFPRIRNIIYNGIWAVRADTLESIKDQFESYVSKAHSVITLPGDNQDAPEEPQQPLYETYATVASTTAVIRINGILGKGLSELETECGGCDVNTITAQLLAAKSDPNVSKICLYISSPGGVSTGIEPLYNLITEIDANSKPVYGYCDTQACSAGYWLLSACRNIYSAVDAELGSIGVYCILVDRTKANEDMGIVYHPISAGEDKLMGAPFLTPSVEQLKFLQDGVNRTYDKFKTAVSAKRSQIDFNKVGARVYDSDQSIQDNLGFTDGIINSWTDALEFIGSIQ